LFATMRFLLVRLRCAVLNRGVATEKQNIDVMLQETREKMGKVGAVDHKKVGVWDLMRFLSVAKNKHGWLVSLAVMNMFYNFNIKLKHRDLTTRLLAASIKCKQHAEGVELIKLYWSWLEHPPKIAVVYTLMGHFLDNGEYLVVRDIAKAVREDWRMEVEPQLYNLTIDAMLKHGGPREAMHVYEDAANFGLRLEASVHTKLLIACMSGVEQALAEASPEMPVEAELQRAVRVADGLARDGHLRGRASTASFCSLSWLFWHLSLLPAASRQMVLQDSDQGAVLFLQGDWVEALWAAMENSGCADFSANLPPGFFRALERSTDPEAVKLVALAHQRFGCFYPCVE